MGCLDSQPVAGGVMSPREFDFLQGELAEGLYLLDAAANVGVDAVVLQRSVGSLPAGVMMRDGAGRPRFNEVGLRTWARARRETWGGR